jgi:hypothetical protein
MMPRKMSRHSSMRSSAIGRIGHGIGLHRQGLDLLVAVPGPVPAARHGAAAAQDGAVEVGRIGEVRDPRHAAGPDHGGLILLAAGRDDVCLGQRLDVGLDADLRQILLDGLGDARLRVGIGDEQLGLEAVADAGLLKQRLAPSGSKG